MDHTAKTNVFGTEAGAKAARILMELNKKIK